ncbi:hypothetical protein GTO10_06525 [Candidatus Saccharibacteria bacterium]|nr:hypothetical protein [Candidatus Saccharibacteria bacterium]
MEEPPSDNGVKVKKGRELYLKEEQQVKEDRARVLEFRQKMGELSREYRCVVYAEPEIVDGKILAQIRIKAI